MVTKILLGTKVFDSDTTFNYRKYSSIKKRSLIYDITIKKVTSKIKNFQKLDKKKV